MPAITSILGKNLMVSSTEVLRVISDGITGIFLKTIASSENNGNRTILSSKMKITRKQYYNRMQSMTKAGLIRRKNGMYYLTSFGKVIYNYQLEIENALNYYWKLEALDSILLSQSSDKAKIPVEEKVNLVDKLIDNDKIKEIIIPIINKAVAGSITGNHSEEEESISALSARR
jgi:Mn-dependent DtxR family transcriptional regulator